MRLRIGAIAAMSAALVTGAAQAEMSMKTVDQCLTGAFDAQTNPNSCVDLAHAECGGMPEDMHAASALCFTKTQEVWNAAIAEQMEGIRARGDDQLSAVAGIETKYDVLSALLQCDRMEELNRLTDQSAELVARQKAGCVSTASGLAYVRLNWRARSLQ